DDSSDHLRGLIATSDEGREVIGCAIGRIREGVETASDALQSVSLKWTEEACRRYGLLQRSVHFDSFLTQRTFKLRKSQVGLIDALEGGDAYFLNKHLDIDVGPLLAIRFDGSHARIGETDPS